MKENESNNRDVLVGGDGNLYVPQCAFDNVCPIKPKRT